MITEKRRISQTRRNWTSRLRASRIDRDNNKRFGPDAPKYAECIWVNPADIRQVLKLGNSKQSASVVEHWPDQMSKPISDLMTIRCCLDHWQCNKSWEQTGVIEQMLAWIKDNGKVDRLSNREQVVKRYEELDALFTIVVKERRLRTRKELIKGNFREEGGILVHIGPDGTPYFGGKGHHRLAIALAAGLDSFPAQLGMIHVDALNSLVRYRSNPG